MSSLEKCLFGPLAHFLTGSFIFLELSCRSWLYIFEISCLSVASFAIIFSHYEDCLFTLLIVSFVVQKLLIDAFELWCWRLLKVPWTARRSNQSILKEISPEYSLEGLMLKLKLQFFGPLMQGTDSFEKTLMLGKIEGRRRRG